MSENPTLMLWSKDLWRPRLVCTKYAAHLRPHLMAAARRRRVLGLYDELGGGEEKQGKEEGDFLETDTANDRRDNGGKESETIFS